MQMDLIEREWTDLDEARHQTRGVTPLTNAADPRWVGIVDLGPSVTYTLDAGNRHDLYVLRGTVAIDGNPFDAGDFLIRHDSAIVQAGEGGARLLVYREVSDVRANPIVRTAKERVWRDGINSRMRVVPAGWRQTACEPGRVSTRCPDARSYAPKRRRTIRVERRT
jgi:uncharacterized protein YbdZ (MbtH family)